MSAMTPAIINSNPRYVLQVQPPMDQRASYEIAKTEFHHGYKDFFGDQYGQNVNKGLESLTVALENELAQIKAQLAQNQAQLVQIQARLNVTA